VQNPENRGVKIRLYARSLSFKDLHAKSREHGSYEGSRVPFWECACGPGATAQFAGVWIFKDLLVISEITCFYRGYPVWGVQSIKKGDGGCGGPGTVGHKAISLCLRRKALPSDLAVPTFTKNVKVGQPPNARRVPRFSARVLINNSDCVDLDQVDGGQRRYTEHHVRRLVLAE
jgi:hypothetical protein